MTDYQKALNKLILNENTDTPQNDLMNDTPYTWAVKAKDDFLSGWGRAQNEAHYIVVLCTSKQEAFNVVSGMASDKALKYVNYFTIKNVINNLRNKSYTIHKASNCTLWNKEAKQ